MAVQTEYSLWSTDVEDTTLPSCRKLGVSLVAYSPLGRGFLTGQIKRFEEALAGGDVKAASEQYQLIVKKLDTIASTSTMHKNTAARKKSRLARKLNSLKAKKG